MDIHSQFVSSQVESATSGVSMLMGKVRTLLEDDTKTPGEKDLDAIESELDFRLQGSKIYSDYSDQLETMGPELHFQSLREQLKGLHKVLDTEVPDLIQEREDKDSLVDLKRRFESFVIKSKENLQKLGLWKD